MKRPLLALVSVSLITSLASCASQDSNANPKTDKNTEMKTEIKHETELVRLTDFPKLNCSEPMNSLLALSKWQEDNLANLKKLNDPEMVENEVRLTTAGLLADDLPFIAVDRECWAEFFTAFSIMLEKPKAGSNTVDSENRSMARKAADDWIICVKAKTPGLLQEAKRLRRCFP